MVEDRPQLCGPLPDEIETQIRNLSYPDIQVLGEELLAFGTLDDLRAWLNARVRDSAGQ
jgi:hypothetical protein